MASIHQQTKPQSQNEIDEYTNFIFKLIDHLAEKDENLTNVVDLTNIFDLPNSKDPMAVLFDYANILSYAGNHYAMEMAHAIKDNNTQELSEIQNQLNKINKAQSFFLSQLS